MIINSKQYNGLCSCGRSHEMATEFCLIESGCLKQADVYLKEYGLQGYTVAVYDENTYLATADRHPQADKEVVLPAEDLHANEHGVALLLEVLPEETEIVIAIGSGTIHDISRYCAYTRHIDFVSCPTAASVDGFCSSVAAMTWHGCKKTLTAVAPKLVHADLDVIKSAPLYLAKSGFGDMVGKYVALTDWKIANILTNEFYCDRIAQMTFDATKAVVDAADGMIAGEAEAYEKLMYGLLLSGLAMQMIGNSRPASGAEHHISHLIEMKPEGLAVRSEALHGEKVGVGTLLAIKEYRRIGSLPQVSFRDYEPFSEAFIADLFGTQMLQNLVEENQNDSAIMITAETLRANWDSICREIAQLPPVEELQKIYGTLGVKATLQDIDIPAEFEAALLSDSPIVRNRLTLMRIRKCILTEE